MPVALPLLWPSIRVLVETSLWEKCTLVVLAFSVGEGMLHDVSAPYALLPAALQAAVRLSGMHCATNGFFLLRWLAPLQTSRILHAFYSIPLGRPGRHGWIPFEVLVKAHPGTRPGVDF